MSVTFHTAKAPSSTVIAFLEANEVEEINQLLKASGQSWGIDPYGDTKLTDHHIERLIGIAAAFESEKVQSALAALEGHACAYVFGE